MKMQDLIRNVFYEPAAILPAYHAAVRELLEAHLSGEARAPGQDICGDKVDVAQAEMDDNWIMHIPIGGVMGYKLDPFERGSGAVDVRDVMKEIQDAEMLDECQGVLFEVDSPGGMVMGTPELADAVMSMKKPRMAFTDGMMCSAAYWAMAGCQGIFATRTAVVGSIGVMQPVFDSSAAYAARGVTVEVIKAGKLKGLGFPGTKLTESQREHLQARVNEIYGMFKDHVTMNRDQMAEETMQGQTFMGAEALQRNLIDGVVGGMSEVLGMF